MPSPLSIRFAQPTEFGAVSEILTEAAAWTARTHEPLWAPAQLGAAAIRADLARARYALAFDSDQPVGTLRLTESDPVFWPEAGSDEAVYLHRLAVRRSHAGGAVSAALLDWSVDQARALRRRRVRLDCEATRTALCALYERFGFRFHSACEVGGVRIFRFELAVPEHE